jgi:hypothetical protein
MNCVRSLVSKPQRPGSNGGRAKLTSPPRSAGGSGARPATCPERRVVLEMHEGAHPPFRVRSRKRPRRQGLQECKDRRVQVEQVKDLRDPRPRHSVQAGQGGLVNRPCVEPPAEFLRQGERRLYGRRPPLSLLPPKPLFRLAKINNHVAYNSPTTGGTCEQLVEIANEIDVHLARAVGFGPSIDHCCRVCMPGVPRCMADQIARVVEHPPFGSATWTTTVRLGANQGHRSQRR